MGKLYLRALVPVPELVDAQNRQLIGPSKQLALLMFLASQPARRATREEVLAYLTGAETGDPRASLRQLLYQIRKATGAIVAGAEELELQLADVEYDVDVFRQQIAAGNVQAALKVYRSDFLGTWIPRDAPEMQEWIDEQRTRLRLERDSFPATLSEPGEAVKASAPRAVRTRGASRAAWTFAAVAGVLVLARALSGSTDRFDARNFGVLAFAWGSPAQPSRKGIATIEPDGQLAVRVMDSVAPLFRSPAAWSNRSRTVTASPCPSRASDLSTVCLSQRWGTLEPQATNGDAVPHGWLGDNALLIEARHLSGDSYARQLVVLHADGRPADTLKELGDAVNDAWPDGSGRFIIVARHEGAADPPVLHNMPRRQWQPISGCKRAPSAAWSGRRFVIACPVEHVLIVGTPDSGLRHISTGEMVPRVAVISPDARYVAAIGDDPSPQLHLYRFDGTDGPRASLPASGAWPVGWFASGDSLPPRPLLTEEFDSPTIDTELWRPFGSPAPRIEGGGVSSTAFFHNGDGSYESGIALRRPLPLAGGLTIEWWAKLPITSTLWQSTYICLCRAPADSFHLRPGPPVSDTVNGQYLYVELPNPHGPAERQMQVNLSGDLRSQNVELDRRLADGKWHAFRLTLARDGEAWLVADGEPIAGPARVDMKTRSATLIVQGRSVKTKILIDELRVWSGAVSPHAMP